MGCNDTSRLQGPTLKEVAQRGREEVVGPQVRVERKKEIDGKTEEHVSMCSYVCQLYMC